MINRTNISTIARVAQGNTLLIGGYTRENTHRHNDKIPLLGDIPLAGRLFQFESVKTEKWSGFLLQPRILQQDFSAIQKLPDIFRLIIRINKVLR